MTDEDVVRTVYLTGPPGSGKTELARQYGETFKNATSSNHTSKPLVITLNAKSKESFLKSVKEAARKLQLSVGMDLTNHNLVDLMKKLRDYFRDYSGAWLLVVDDIFGNELNYLFPQPGIREWGGGRVLVTTQDNNLVPACHQYAKIMSLEKGMTKEDAFALLNEISGVEVDDFAEEIIKELQSLPLALACCATYVGETRQDRASTQFGWEDYLNLYREKAKLESRSYSNNNNVYPFSMTTASTMAVNRMAKTSDVLRLTFSFLSYCALLPVPLNVLAHHVKENLPVPNYKQPTKDNEISEIESEISRCTLLNHERSQNVETIICHQVIHDVFQSVENAKSVEQREIEFVKMMKSLSKTLDFMDNTDKEDVLLKLLVRPHLKSFVDHAIDMSWNNTAEFVLISMKNGQFLFSTSDMPDEKAVESLELLYNMSLEIHFSDQRRCDILANLGFYYLELDRDHDAWNFLCMAYSMTEGKSENEWLLLRCRISYNLARTYYRMDSVDGAVAMMKKSIDLAKEVYMKEEDKIMNRYFWLSSFYFSWDKFWKLGEVVDEATEFFNSCPADCVSVNRARCLSDLASVCFYGPVRFWTGNITLAEHYLNKSLDIFEQILGSDVSSCQEYCALFALSAVLTLKANPTEGRTQLDKALEYCVRCDHKVGQSLIVAVKKHILDYSSQHWFVRILKVPKKHWKFAEINMLDDILEDCNSGRISPSRRIINNIKTARRSLVWRNYVTTFQCFLLVCIILFLIISLYTLLI